MKFNLWSFGRNSESNGGKKWECKSSCGDWYYWSYWMFNVSVLKGILVWKLEKLIMYVVVIGYGC